MYHIVIYHTGLFSIFLYYHAIFVLNYVKSIPFIHKIKTDVNEQCVYKHNLYKQF